VRLGNPPFLFVDEGLVEREQQPVAVRDEDVVEEFAEFPVVGGRAVQFNGAQKMELAHHLWRISWSIIVSMASIWQMQFAPFSPIRINRV
jgi:hypothetical protein